MSKCYHNLMNPGTEHFKWKLVREAEEPSLRHKPHTEMLSKKEWAIKWPCFSSLMGLPWNIPLLHWRIIRCSEALCDDIVMYMKFMRGKWKSIRKIYSPGHWRRNESCIKQGKINPIQLINVKRDCPSVRPTSYKDSTIPPWVN